MNINEKEGNWEEQKSSLKETFAKLTNNDFMFAKGQQEEMINKLQMKLGKTKEELQKILAAI